MKSDDPMFSPVLEKFILRMIRIPNRGPACYGCMFERIECELLWANKKDFIGVICYPRHRTPWRKYNYFPDHVIEKKNWE